jgi:hypothetical protein
MLKIRAWDSPARSSLPRTIAEILPRDGQYRTWLRIRDSYRKTPFSSFYFRIVGNTEIILAGADWLRNVDLSLVIRTADALFLRHLAEHSNWR